MSNYTNNLFIRGSTNNCWAILFGYVTNGARVLDVGCSSGNFGEVLVQEKKCQVIGLDINSQDIKIAKKKLTDALVFDIEKDDLSKLGKFDFVIFADVLEHLTSPIEALKRAKIVLKTEGKVLFSIPNMAHISTRLSVIEGSFKYTPTGILDKTHLHYYDEDEVKYIFSEAQFKIEQLTPTTLTYPDKMVTNRLQKIGIEPSKKFFQHLSKSKAHIYQFVGCAVPNDKKIKNSILRYKYPVDELKEEMARSEKLTSNHVHNLKNIIERQEAHINSLDRELKQIKSSRRWRAVTKLSKLTKQLRVRRN